MYQARGWGGGGGVELELAWNFSVNSLNRTREFDYRTQSN